jgi:hypothetical protein
MAAARKRAPAKVAAAPPAASQRERLLGRARPSLPYRLLLDADALAAAQAEQQRVERVARQVLIREDPGSVAHRKAEQQIAGAAAAVDACYETVVLRALPTVGEVTVETLIDAHPPTSEQMAAAKAERDKARQRGDQPPDWPSWDDRTFFPALLEACADNDMTAADWVAFFAKNVSDGERAGIQLAALAVNERERVADAMVLPFGSTRMPS